MRLVWGRRGDPDAVSIACAVALAAAVAVALGGSFRGKPSEWAVDVLECRVFIVGVVFVKRKWAARRGGGGVASYDRWLDSRAFREGLERISEDLERSVMGVVMNVEKSRGWLELDWKNWMNLRGLE